MSLKARRGGTEKPAFRPRARDAPWVLQRGRRGWGGCGGGGVGGVGVCVGGGGGQPGGGWKRVGGGRGVRLVEPKRREDKEGGS